MKPSLTGMLLGVLALSFSGLPVRAHHSFAAEYDGTKPVKVSGTVTKVEWTNPHIWFFVDVKDEKGRVTNWGFSAGPPASRRARSRLATW